MSCEWNVKKASEMSIVFALPKKSMEDLILGEKIVVGGGYIAV